ncbi:hypothetical protein E5288_WYG018591 [Bos mutus]|uniref:Uncharacterized protein n=1 Tax=Bos mutus TaxID=72004 RepID=A0A6B0S6E8_9CETA|nr:hypothetical protein [Bos mutus]
MKPSFSLVESAALMHRVPLMHLVSTKPLLKGVSASLEGKERWELYYLRKSKSWYLAIIQRMQITMAMTLQSLVR